MSVKRQARGEERRKVILHATLELIERSGIEAVTHRAVGEASGVPLGSVTYYFPTRDGLLREALELWVDEEVERLSAVAEAISAEELSPSEGAARWGELLRGNDPHQAAQFELYLHASRTPELREAAAQAFAAYERVAAAALRAAGLPAEAAADAAALFVALADGMGLRRLAEPGARGVFDDALVRLFEGLGR
jgi:TetR/AcrR family transcriptional regulator, regulator of biofilm formation and stress response